MPPKRSTNSSVMAMALLGAALNPTFGEPTYRHRSGFGPKVTDTHTTSKTRARRQEAKRSRRINRQKGK